MGVGSEVSDAQCPGPMSHALPVACLEAEVSATSLAP